MADIIRLRGSPHEQAQMLLPWYVNGTLDAQEKADVEAHLAACAECRTDVEAERMLAAELESMPLETAHGWEALARRLDVVAPEPEPEPARPIAFLRRPVRLGWAIAAQALAAALVFAVMTAVPGAPSAPIYHALGSRSAAAPANIVVLFDPQTSEQAMRAALIEADARLVDGPTATGAYMAHVAPERRDAALAALRRVREVVVAQPIDPGAAQ
jgi:anti-sigma-K factor RskA